MENKAKEAEETKKRHGRLMRNVAYTFTHKNTEVKALLKQADPEIPDDASRGRWVQSLMKQFRTNKEFTVSFAELMLDKKSLKEKIRSIGKKETVEQRAERVKSKGSENFCCFEGYELPGDPGILADQLSTAANSISDTELEGLVKNSQQAKNSQRIIVIGALALTAWLIYNKWIK